MRELLALYQAFNIAARQAERHIYDVRFCIVNRPVERARKTCEFECAFLFGVSLYRINLYAVFKPELSYEHSDIACDRASVFGRSVAYIRISVLVRTLVGVVSENFVLFVLCKHAYAVFVIGKKFVLCVDTRVDNRYDYRARNLAQIPGFHDFLCGFDVEIIFAEIPKFA